MKAPKDLREWIKRVEDEGMLLRIRQEVDPDEEMAGIAYMAAQQVPSPALLFENIKGYPQKKMLFNMIGSSSDRFALTLGLPTGLARQDMIQGLRERLKNRIPPVVVDNEKAPVYENSRFGQDIRISEFPAARHWPLDGGSYIGTADIVVTRDPENGILNVGTYRQMVHNDNQVGIMFSPGKDARAHMEKYFQQGKAMPIAAAYGVDPLLMIVGAQSFGKNVCEYDSAGGLIGTPIEVTKGKATDLLIPAHAEIVIEGLIYPDATKFEGPFGEFTGYYGRPPEKAPYIEIQAVHFRNDPIVTAALMADYPACELELFISYMRSARLYDDFDKMGVPGLKGVFCFPQAASGYGMTVVSIQQQYPGHAAQALAVAAQAPGAAYFTKWIVAVDEDVDPTDINQVLWALATRSNPLDDIDFLRNTWSTWLDPSQNPPEKRPYGSKVLINACKSHQHLKTFSKRTALRKSVYERIANRWNELKLPGEAPKLNFLYEE